MLRRMWKFGTPGLVGRQLWARKGIGGAVGRWVVVVGGGRASAQTEIVVEVAMGCRGCAARLEEVRGRSLELGRMTGVVRA